MALYRDEHDSLRSHAEHYIREEHECCFCGSQSDSSYRHIGTKTIPIGTQFRILAKAQSYISKHTVTLHKSLAIPLFHDAVGSSKTARYPHSVQIFGLHNQQQI